MTNLLDAAQQEWRRWLAKADLPSTLTPESAANVLNRLDAAREQLKAIESDRERIHQMNEAIREYDRQVKSVAAASGCDTVIPKDAEAAVHFLVARLEEHDQHTRKADEAARKVAEAEKATAQAQRKVDKAQQARQQAQDVEQKCQQQWKDLLQRLGLRDSLAVESAPQFFQAIERARDQLVQVHELRRQARVSQEGIESYCQDVRLVSKTIGRQVAADADVSQAVAALSAELDQAEEDRRDSEKLTERIQDLETRTKGLQRQIDQRRQEIDDLLKAAGTTDEETFRRNAADYETRRVLNHQIRQLETRLLQLAGSGDTLKEMKEGLAYATPEDVNSEQKDLEEKIETNDRQKTDAVGKRGRLKEQLERLEKSDELSRLRIEQQADRAEFATMAEEWSVLRIATHLIDRAREKYERERRPGVLKEAERYFARFTNGSYTEIRAPADGDQVIVLAPDGSTKEIGQLSRGTAEQLYLSLRFGFVQAFVARSEPLPLVFDDILVNFDPDRARATVEAIVDLSKSLQILLFTCQSSTVDLMKDVGSSIPVYTLKDGRFTIAS